MGEVQNDRRAVGLRFVSAVLWVVSLTVYCVGSSVSWLGRGLEGWAYRVADEGQVCWRLARIRLVRPSEAPRRGA